MKTTGKSPLGPCGPRKSLFMAIMMATLGVEAAEQIKTNSPIYELEEVVVTAQKRDQSLMDVGISVSVVDEKSIRDSRIEKVTDIVLFTANTSVKENFPGLMPVITIRGVGLNDFNAANNPAAGVYIDEVSLSSLALMSSEFIDLASVEVLKGPQGTLYGRNSTAGALNFHTAKPNLDAFEARLSGGIGNYGATEVEAMINAPLNQEFGLRAAAKRISQNEGYWDNRATGSDIGERDELIGRLQALWEPADHNLSALLKLEGQRGRSELGAPEFFGALPTATATNCPGSPSCSNFAGYTDTDGDPFTGDWSTDPDYDQNQFASTLRLETDLGFAELTSVTGYIDFDRTYSTDVDASPLALIDFTNSDDVQQFSQELRLAGSHDIADWQLGLFYAVDEVETRYDGNLGLFNTTTQSITEQKATSKAVFANIDWMLNDTLTLITGLRYSDEKKANQGTHLDLVSSAPGSNLSLAPFGSQPITLASVDEEINDSSVEWKLGLNWKPSDTTLIYASATQGTKSGGFFTGAATSSAQLKPYDKETLSAFELGIKSQLPEYGVSYELNTFIYDYDDVQTFIRDTSGALPIQRLSNVDGAEIYGLDASLRIRPPSIVGLTLGANLGLLRTKLKSFESSQGPIAEGNDLPDSPRTSLHLSTSYDTQFSQNLRATFALDGRYQSASYRDALNDPLLKSDSYWVVNGRVSLYFNDDLELSLWGKNLTDEQYVTQGLNQIVLGNGFRVYGAPRTYGLSVTKHFE
jgi:iron complex outermembrane recepter protein